jgi:alkylation response protein AidB-like acyl-CoA dehydrogenase
MPSALARSIADVLPAIAQRAADAEVQRRVPDPTIGELVRAGMFRAFVPRRHGGDEQAPTDVFDAATLLGTACASSSWVAILCATHSLIVAWFDAEAQSDVWGAGPDAIIASSLAPLGRVQQADGGYRISGRWQFASGIDHAAWIIVGAPLPAEPQPRHGLFLVPARELAIVDDWHVASVELVDAFVPAHRVETMEAIAQRTARGLRVNTSPLFQIPWRPFFSYAFTPPALGTALAALSAFRAHNVPRRSAYTGAAQRDKPAAWARLAEAAADVDLARLLARRDIEQITRGGDDRSSRRAHGAATVVELCSRSVSRLYRGSGGSALYETSPLQRHFRDMHAITQHPGVSLDILREAYGKALFEMDDDFLALGADS